MPEPPPSPPPSPLTGLGPLLPGVSDIDQLAKMVATLGSIHLEQWPEAAKLPDWDKIMFGEQPSTPLAQLLPDASPEALTLLSKLIR